MGIQQAKEGILVTGASGFLASELLPRLLRAYPESTIYLLLRAEDNAQLATRRQTVLDYSGIDEDLAKRVVALAGDIKYSDCGLGAEYDKYLKLVKEIYHSAACTRFDQKLERAREINVNGTAHVLEFARRATGSGHFTRLHHVSTAYVAGNRVGVVKERELNCGQGFFNTYEESKYEAELLLSQAMNDVPITIYRPSIIVGDSQTGRTLHFHVVYEPMKWVYSGQMNFLPCRPELKLDIVPVDYVCDAMIALAQHPTSLAQTYHLIAGPERSIDISELVERCIKQFNDYNAGIGRPVIDSPEIITPQKIEQLKGDARQQQELFFQRAWQQMQRHMPYTVSEKVFDDAQARGALVEKGIYCPTFREYLPNIVGYGLERQFSS